jgi:3-dehydroquinate dehydratase-1
MNPVTVKNITFGEGIPKICVPLVASDTDTLLSEAKKLAAAPAELVEWRADWQDNIFSEGAVCRILNDLSPALGGKPLLFTFRTKKEGGNQAASPFEYKKLLTDAILSGMIDMVDIELFSGEEPVKELISLAKSHHVKVICSNHDFSKTPSEDELFSRLSRMEELGADIAKIAVMPTCPEDVLTLLSATARAKKTLSCPVITMSMSGTGLISRLSGEIFGSCLTFGSVGTASAPGQIDAGELRTILEVIHKSL